MWKIAVGFVLFAALALFIIFKAGDKVDMQGESGNPTEAHVESASATATEKASASLPAATTSAIPAVDPSAISASK
ncbi:hypothetical protein [Undibacterium sp. Ren11W]|uniref:hypothetical protein n=1 Tax=Undibacterium sp. Ren11W TaxID=3413045 RepID=UPI003BF1AFFA